VKIAESQGFSVLEIAKIVMLGTFRVHFQYRNIRLPRIFIVIEIFPKIHPIGSFLANSRHLSTETTSLFSPSDLLQGKIICSREINIFVMK
jgi:hypothetical protein